MAEAKPIVTIENLTRRRKILGLPIAGPRIPQVKSGMHLYVSTLQPDGSRELRRMMGDESDNMSQSLGEARFYHVGLDSYCFAPTFSKVLIDDHKHEWDCTITGQLSVSDSRRVLTSFAASLAGPNSPVTSAMAESWIANRIAPQVHDAVRKYNIANLRDHHALPPSWWEKQLAQWLDGLGVTVCVNEVSWSSAQAEAAEAEAARRRELERIAEAKQREHEAELQEAAARAEYEKQRKQIESDIALSDQEREHQLQLLERRHRKELIEADNEIEGARRDAEKAALEHEATLARLRQDADAVQLAEERGCQAQEQHQAVMKQLDGLKETLAKLVDAPENLLARLADQDVHKANVAAERIVSPEFGVSASALAGLGFRVERQSLVESLREHAAVDGAVTIRKTELVTRDIGTAKVKGLPINTSLQFEFSTQRTGYVTLLNIGTSGSLYVHVPNAYIPLEQARVNGGRSYDIPGPELLPWDRLRQLSLDYIEVGPPGWEHVAVIVSDTPVICASALGETSLEAPFIALETSDIAGLCDSLTNRSEDSWSASILSFLVGP